MSQENFHSIAISRRSLTVLILLVVLSRYSVVCQTNSADKCPDFNLITSLKAVVEGDIVRFNIVTRGGKLAANKLRYTWKAYPRGKVVVDRDSSIASLDTSSVRGSWVIVSAEFADWRECSWTDSSEVKIRRKGPYTLADEFWWWFQLNSEHIRAFNDPDHDEWLRSIGLVLSLVDERLTYKIDTERADPMNQAFFIGYRGKPYNVKLVNDFISRAPKLAGWEFIAEKPSQ